MFDPAKPYNELPLLPPKQELETRTILKQCIKAHTALAELRQAGQIIPNQEALINSLPLLEANDSSRIENIVTTKDKLFRQANMNEKTAPKGVKETLRYRTALFEGYEAIQKKPLSTATAIAVCRTIKGNSIDIRKLPGTIISNDRTGEIIYVPPMGEDVIREKLSNLWKFIHSADEIDPLVRMAVMHYQFEAIHPFPDGNGRTGRILNILFLLQEGLLDLPILYLSHFILRNRDDYYRLLLGVTTEGAWEPWISYMLTAIETTATWTLEKIRSIKDLMTHTAEFIQNNAPGSYSHELVELIFEQPYCRIADVMDAGIAKRHRAGHHLRQLATIGVLQEIKAGRQKLFIHPKYLTLLTNDENSYAPYTPTTKKIPS